MKRRWHWVVAVTVLMAPLWSGPAPVDPDARFTEGAAVQTAVHTTAEDDPATSCDVGTAGYRLPVAAEVVDWFRPPANRWGPGNRGWEFGTVGGEVVCAVGAGTVTFAGQVAGRGVVSLRHSASVVSSVTGLAEVFVKAGRSVAAGEVIGTAIAGLHVGFRVDGRYVDPAQFFDAPTHAVLVPLPER
ncbi:MAG: murein hydrolase activator EnvC family protein [Microthrixaceae bacterium]